MGEPHINAQHGINAMQWGRCLQAVFEQQRGIVFPCYRARQRYALELSVQLTVDPRLNRFHLRHFDPVLTSTHTHAVVAGLFTVFALELRITGGKLRVKKVLEGFIEVDARLLECNRIKILEPVILAGLFRHRQQRLKVFLGLELQAVAFVL